MAMNTDNSRSGDEPDVMMDINTTPLIDVMLVLLIMLIITIPIQLHAVNLDMPVGTPPVQAAQPQVVKIDIDDKSVVYWNAEAVADRETLEAKMRELAALPLSAQPEIHLRPNRFAKYEVVATVMASIQRQGLVKFGVVGSEQFVD